jgi:hypothetical protein
MKSRILILPLALVMAGGVAAVPAEAQGNARGQQQRELREERRDREQPRLERRDDRRDRERTRAQGVRQQGPRSVPPGWCIGRGNPHNTPANCGYRDSRGRTVRYDTRYERRGSGSGSYEDAHRAFHREHDAWCRARENERPLDIRWRASVRRQCQEAHDRFHREWGIAHRR